MPRGTARHGWSLEEEVRQILRKAVVDDTAPMPLGSRIAARFNALGFSGEWPELRGDKAREAHFGRRDRWC